MAWKLLQKHFARTRLVFLIATLIALVLAGVGGYVAWHHSIQEDDVIYRIAPSEVSGSQFKVQLAVVLTSADLAKGTVVFRIQPSVCGCLVQNGPKFKRIDAFTNTTAIVKPSLQRNITEGSSDRPDPPSCDRNMSECSYYTNRDVVLLYDTNRKLYRASRHEALTPLDASTMLTEGSQYNYPFDTYTARFDLIAYVRQAVNGSVNPLKATEDDYIFEWPAIEILFHDTISAFWVETEYDYEKEEMVVNMRRINVTYVTAMAVILIQWCLAIVFAVVGFDVAYNKRALELPLCVATSTMIFSLPNLRNTMPNAPPIGCAADMLSLFWAELILATVAFVMLWTYIYRWDGKRYYPSPPKPPEIAADPQNADQISKGDLAVGGVGGLDSVNTLQPLGISSIIRLNPPKKESLLAHGQI